MHRYYVNSDARNVIVWIKSTVTFKNEGTVHFVPHISIISVSLSHGLPPVNCVEQVSRTPQIDTTKSLGADSFSPQPRVA